MSPINNVISVAQTSTSMSSLDSLDIPTLPFVFKDLLKLRSLCVVCGSELQLTEDLARILGALKATNCQKLEASATTSQISHTDAFPLIDCRSPVRISGSKNYLKSLLIQIGTKCQVPNIDKDILLQTADGPGDSFLLPCDNNSDWLTFSCKDCSVTFEVPKMNGRNLKRMMLFIIYCSSLDNITSEGCQAVLIINYTKTTILAYRRDTLTSFEDEEWQSITSNLEPGNKVQVMVVFGEGFIVEKTTIYLSYDEPVDKEMEHCHTIDEDVIVSGDDDKNVSVSGGDNIDLPPDKNAISFGEDKHWHAVDKNVIVSGDDYMTENRNYAVSGGGDMAADKNVIVSGEDGNVSVKNSDAVDKDVNVLGEADKDVNVSGEADKNVVVSGRDENRFRKLFTLPSLVRAVLISRPFWFGLVGILVWITCRHFKKRRSRNVITRYTQRGKWLVDRAQKLITYKKANEAHGVIPGSSTVKLGT